MRWFTSLMGCAICSTEWNAVFAETASKLECPRCHYLNTLPDDPEELDADEAAMLTKRHPPLSP